MTGSLREMMTIYICIDGAVNIDGLLRRLEKDGYTGFCTMEPHTTPEKCLDFYREETAYLRERGIKE